MSYLLGELSREKHVKTADVFELMCTAMKCDEKFEVINKNHVCLAMNPHIEKLKIHDKEIIVMLDGEIFNQDELRALCESKGYSVESNRDEEIMMKLYLGFHEDCVSKVNGSFSLVILDELNEMCLLSRDPIGLKPLFYTMTKDGVVFSSLIRGLLKHPDVKACASSEELMEMILIGPGRTPGKTYFKDIEEIKPGTVMTITKNGINITHYALLHDEKWKKSEQETQKLVYDLVCDAVSRQSEGDVCAMLSGGLDSSIVCALASRSHPGLRTYSVDYQNQKEYFKSNFYQPDRDQDYIGLMSQQYDLDAHDIILDHQILKDTLKEAMIARDMPSMADVDSSLLCFLRKIKENGETVVLSGECSDEIFGGYPWYTQDHLKTLKHFPWAHNVKERASYLKEEFIACDPEVFVEKRIRQSLASLRFRKGITQEEKEMKQLMKLNLDWFMSVLTDRAERMSRCTGLIIRVPFCDLNIVNTLYQIPWSMKLKDGIEKALLRSAFESELPAKIAWRKKSPYPKTHHPEYEQMIREELVHVIEDETSPIHEIIRKEKLIELLNQKNPVPWYGQLMTGPQTMAYFLQINDWLKEYHVEIIHPNG